MGNEKFKIEVWGMYAEENPVVILYFNTRLELEIAEKIFENCYHMPHEVKKYEKTDSEWMYFD